MSIWTRSKRLLSLSWWPTQPDASQFLLQDQSWEAKWAPALKDARELQIEYARRYYGWLKPFLLCGFLLLTPWEKSPDNFSSLESSLFFHQWLHLQSNSVWFFSPFELVTVQFLKHISSLFISEATLQRQTFHLQQNVSTFPPWNNIHFSAVIPKTSSPLSPPPNLLPLHY